jgi:hypothetical protein
MNARHLLISAALTLTATTACDDDPSNVPGLLSAIVGCRFEFHEDAWGSASAAVKDFVSRLLVADPRYRLLGAIAVMSHPFFAPIDFQRHALSAGHVGPPPMPAQPLSIPHSLHHSHHSLHSLAAAGGSLPARGLPSPYPPLPPYQRNGSGGSFHKSTLDQVVSADGGLEGGVVAAGARVGARVRGRGFAFPRARAQAPSRSAARRSSRRCSP